MFPEREYFLTHSNIIHSFVLPLKLTQISVKGKPITDPYMTFLSPAHTKSFSMILDLPDYSATLIA